MKNLFGYNHLFFKYNILVIIIKIINIDELNNIDNYYLIDVRDNSVYNLKHLNRAINIPLSNILTILDKYKKDNKLVLYCKNGIRSKRACEILIRFGYINVYNLINVEKYLI